MTEEELQRYLEEVVIVIAERIEEQELEKEEQAQVLIEEIVKLLDQFGSVVEEVIPEIIAKSYFGGVDEASAALIDAKALASSPAAVTPSGTISRPFKKNVHLEAVGSILDDTLLDLRAAIRTAQESAAVNITESLAKVQKDIAQGLIVGDTRRATTARVARSFQEGGLTSFVTSDGKRLPLDFYSKLVTATKTREASVTGSSKRYEDVGQDLVQIVGNADTCEVCARFQGMVVSLTGKTPGYPVVSENGIRLGPYHPHCRCGTRPFVISRKTEEEIQAVQQRNSQYNPNKDRRTKAQREAYEREQEGRRKANAEKKQYARWKMVLGDDAPKTIGAFRRMKRENTTKFQELSAEYRRILREDVRK